MRRSASDSSRGFLVESLVCDGERSAPMDGIHAHVNHVSGSRCAETSKGGTSNGGSAAEAVAAAQAGDDVARSVADRAAPASGPRGDVHAHERWRDQPIFSEFHVTNPKSRNTYRFVIRGSSPGTHFCSCPDLATNTLGTCKHVEFVSEEVEEGHSEAEEGYRLDPAVRRSPRLAG